MSYTIPHKLSSIIAHKQYKGHFIDWDAVSIKDTDSKDNRRLIREAKQIRKDGLTMNRNFRYQLPQVYKQLLHSTATDVFRLDELKLQFSVDKG